MGAYISRRLLLAVPVLLLITILNFMFIHLSPGDPVLMMLPPEMIERGQLPSEERLAELRRRMGLDQPVPIQYVNWLKEIIRGNLGMSIKYRQPVSDLLATRIAPTVRLNAAALAVGLTIGLGVGILAAVKRYSLFDYISTVLAFVSLSVPNFFLGLVFIYVFALKLGWFPTSGMRTIGGSGGTLDLLRHLTLPALVIGLSSAASFVRYMRASLLEVLHLDFIQTARAKGASERAVVWLHGLRNALLPVITVVSLQLPTIIGGSVVVESLFNYPGMGSFAIEAVFAKDFPVIMAINLLTSILVLAANLLADIAYAVADPRIRYS